MHPTCIQIHAQDKISDYYFYAGLNFVSATIVFTSSSVLRYSNEIKSPGLSGSRSRYSRVANRRYAKIESSFIVQKKKHQRPRILPSNRFIFYRLYYKQHQKIKITNYTREDNNFNYIRERMAKKFAAKYCLINFILRENISQPRDGNFSFP